VNEYHVLSALASLIHKEGKKRKVGFGPVNRLEIVARHVILESETIY
jgi:hypothetical protein